MARVSRCMAVFDARLLMCRGAVLIPGVKNARQAQDNTGGMGWRLGQDEVAALDAASQEIGHA